MQTTQFWENSIQKTTRRSDNYRKWSLSTKEKGIPWEKITIFSHDDWYIQRGIISFWKQIS